MTSRSPLWTPRSRLTDEVFTASEAVFRSALAGGDDARLHVVVELDGGGRGSWRHTAKARSVEVTTDLDRPLDDTEQVALGAAAARFGAFMTRPAVLR